MVKFLSQNLLDFFDFFWGTRFFLSYIPVSYNRKIRVGFKKLVTTESFLYTYIFLYILLLFLIHHFLINVQTLRFELEVWIFWLCQNSSFLLSCHRTCCVIVFIRFSFIVWEIFTVGKFLTQCKGFTKFRNEKRWRSIFCFRCTKTNQNKSKSVVAIT